MPNSSSSPNPAGAVPCRAGQNPQTETELNQGPRQSHEQAAADPTGGARDQRISQDGSLAGIPRDDSVLPEISETQTLGDNALGLPTAPDCVKTSEDVVTSVESARLSPRESACGENGHPLPPEWERRIYYLDPARYILRNNKHGEQFYYNSASQERSWQMPGYPRTLSKEDPPLPPGWQIWETIQGEQKRMFYYDQNLKLQTWDRPQSTRKGIHPDVTADDGLPGTDQPVKVSWECWKTQDQRQYFVHTPTGIKTWFMPIADTVQTELDKEEINIENSPTIRLAKIPAAAWRDHANYTRDRDGEYLPRFWERRPVWYSSSRRSEYYIDHINRRSQWSLPRETDGTVKAVKMKLATEKIWMHTGSFISMSMKIDFRSYFKAVSDWIELLDLAQSIVDSDLESTDAEFVEGFGSSVKGGISSFRNPYGYGYASYKFGLDSAAFASVIRFYTGSEEQGKGTPAAPRHAGYGVLALRLKSSLILIAQGRNFNFAWRNAVIFPLVLVVLQKEPIERGRVSYEGQNFLDLVFTRWNDFISKCPASNEVESEAESEFDHQSEPESKPGRFNPASVTREKAFFLARLWLERHWATSLFQQVYLSHESRDYIYWDDLPQAILDLKAGRNNVFSWLHACGFALNDDPGPEQRRFELLFKQASEEAASLREAVDLRNAQKTLEATSVSIEESRRGIAEAHTIGRITHLAYVFLPLTFITGVFGMNIQPFEGGAQMWKSWVTLFCVLIPSWAFGLWTARGEVRRQFNNAKKSLCRAEAKRIRLKSSRQKRSLAPPLTGETESVTVEHEV
ncbi:hypothetical protein LTR84_011712 [Exophiala bonariae]|uniref:WW domain-containing protein n=1 Tax=Exophiala bonariae TaxID=1690606 RepID=A0AAV9NJ78_9EURO|nr:hypothetical protein LTR84_011712 [Exophiala bonariae]